MTHSLTADQAVWWLRLAGTAVRLQHERVRDCDMHRLTDELFVDCWQLAAATYRFGATLKQSQLQTAYAAFQERVGGLEKFRHVCEHADEWLRGQGGLGRRARGRLDGFQVLVPAPANPRRDTLVFEVRGEGVGDSKFYMPLAMWPATRAALEVAAKELPGGHQLQHLLSPH